MSERDIIAAFVARLEGLRPELVTFNGHGFDLPVLRYRAMVHSLSAPGLNCRSYFNRFLRIASTSVTPLRAMMHEAR